MRPFTYYLRVRYGEWDAQRVVFNPRYGDYADVAVIEFLRALGYGDQLLSGGLDFQLVKQTTEWRGPARFDQVLAASVFASRIGTTSFTFTTEFRIAGDDRVICTVETVYVMVDTHTLAKKPIPDEVRTTFERGAPGVVADHAGYW